MGILAVEHRGAGASDQPELGGARLEYPRERVPAWAKTPCDGLGERRFDVEGRRIPPRRRGGSHRMTEFPCSSGIQPSHLRQRKLLKPGTSTVTTSADVDARELE